MGVALLAISAPVYWLGLVALYLFANDIGKFPIFAGPAPIRAATSSPTPAVVPALIMPWFVLAAVVRRDLRALPARQPDRDDVRGLHPHRARQGPARATVIFQHGVRSAITPIVTILGLDIGILLGGAILTETVFNIPGIGRLAYNAIQQTRPAGRSRARCCSARSSSSSLNLVVDILYAFLDPRVRY